MIIKISPSKVLGQIQAPASKSAMQRAAALALLNEGQTIIKNSGTSNDDKAALSIIQNLGAVVENQSDDSLLVTGSRWHKNEETNESVTINCGESGLGIRMFTPIAALGSQDIIITGSGSLLTRPMDFFDEVLPQLQVSIRSNEGKLPMHITGPLQPKDSSVDGSLSSQFLTGLLIAFAKAATATVSITVNDLKSKPYIDLTLQMMKHFGYDVTHEDHELFTINPVQQDSKNTINYTVEGDWSGGAFLLVAGAIAGDLNVTGLDPQSAQADKAILQALKDCNAMVKNNQDGIEIKKSNLTGFTFDATDCPDLFPPLVALAANCKGTTTIKGTSRLTHKESNRALTLQEEFGKMGLDIQLEGDEMIINGGGVLKGTKVHSRHDHRIAMALAVAGLCAEGDTIIEDADAVNKSYPAFFDDLKKMNAVVSEVS